VDTPAQYFWCKAGLFYSAEAYKKDDVNSIAEEDSDVIREHESQRLKVAHIHWVSSLYVLVGDRDMVRVHECGKDQIVRSRNVSEESDLESDEPRLE